MDAETLLKINDTLSEMEKYKEFQKEFRSEIRLLDQWNYDMRRFMRLPNSKYKFQQIGICISAIHSLSIRLERLHASYQTEHLPQYHD